MQGDAPNTPGQLSSPTDVGEAAASRQADLIADALQKAETSRLDIRDPFTQREVPEPDPKAVPTPETLPGATADGGFTDALLQRAYEAGIDAVEAKDYGTPKTLEKAIGHIERQAQNWARQQQYVPPQQPYHPPQQPAQQPPELPALDASEFDERLVGAITARDKHYQAQIAQQQQQLQQMHAFLQQQQAQVAEQQATQTRREIDSLFAGVGEEMKQVFGSGGRYQLSERSPEFTARMAVLDEMDVMDAGYRATGRTPPPRDVLFERAVRTIHGDKVEETATRKVQEQLRNDSGQFMAPPTKRNGRELPPGDEKALQTATRMMRQMGW